MTALLITHAPSNYVTSVSLVHWINASEAQKHPLQARPVFLSCLLTMWEWQPTRISIMSYLKQEKDLMELTCFAELMNIWRSQSLSSSRFCFPQWPVKCVQKCHQPSLKAVALPCSSPNNLTQRWEDPLPTWTLTMGKGDNFPFFRRAFCGCLSAVGCRSHSLASAACTGGWAAQDWPAQAHSYACLLIPLKV